MKVVIFPGVGFHNNKDRHKYFAEKLKSYYGDSIDVEIHYWLHNFDIPEIKLPWGSIRAFIYEVILDFQQIVNHAMDMEVPEADYYIGHSAGSVLALVQKKPCIIFGSPSTLIECIRKDGTRCNDKLLAAMCSNHRGVLNVVNKYDQLAYFLDHDHVENYIYSNWWINPNSYNPIAAHSDYWKNKKIIKKMVNKIKEWEQK